MRWVIQVWDKTGFTVIQRLFTSDLPLPYLDLFIGGDRTEDNLRKALGGKHPETDSSDHLGILHQC